MKKLVLSVLILAVAALGLGQLYAQSPEDAKLQKMIDGYLDGMWRFFPTAATLAGNPKYNDKLEDFGSGPIEKRINALDAFNQELVAKIDKSKLSPESQILHSMMIDALDLEFVRFENLLPWEYNPLFYNEILLQSVRGLLVKDGAPIDARVKSATERAKLLPGLIKKAKENLKTPAQLYTETAIKQIPAIIEFYKTEAPALAAGAAAKSGFLAELAKVVAALEDYQRFLQNELLPKSTGNFRLGADTHLRLLRMTSQGSIPIDELVARANADVKNIRREMFLVCIPFYQIMYPGINLEQMTTQRSEEEVKNIVIKGVLDKIKVEHADREDWVAKIAASAARRQGVPRADQALDVPDAELSVEPMPGRDGGSACTRLVAPGAYEANGGYTFQVMPIPADWTERTGDFLPRRATTTSPGLPDRPEGLPRDASSPRFFTRKDPSVVKKLYANQALLKGWPAYSRSCSSTPDSATTTSGSASTSSSSCSRPSSISSSSSTSTRAAMTKEQAINYMVRRASRPTPKPSGSGTASCSIPATRPSLHRATRKSWTCEKEYKKLKGDAFNQKEFAQKLLSFGAIPLRELKIQAGPVIVRTRSLRRERRSRLSRFFWDER